MSVADEIINNPHFKFYKTMFEQLDSETLHLAMSDRAKTLEYVKENVKREQPEKINDTEYIDALVTEMQKVAKEILENRAKN